MVKHNKNNVSDFCLSYSHFYFLTYCYLNISLDIVCYFGSVPIIPLHVDWIIRVLLLFCLPKLKILELFVHKKTYLNTLNLSRQRPRSSKTKRGSNQLKTQKRRTWRYHTVIYWTDLRIRTTWSLKRYLESISIIENILIFENYKNLTRWRVWLSECKIKLAESRSNHRSYF